jgi:hypothetical protein
MKQPWQMLATLDRVAAQAMDGAQALLIARERFPNLCCSGILSRKAVGKPVDIGDVEIALMILRQCRPAKAPGMHTFDMRKLINVQHGALIAAATALGFDVHSCYGTRTYAPHALISINQGDVRRQMTNYHP